ncbi:hypothetical protein CDD80_2761 [Ophiocordyceps camponoti-rufipedis]|uniref:FAS1 domain-containing protein n=1 Tax=Ophiocordyceps camponoti-rufipedis TaxID=2004952 RepID=A0A2C5Z6U7_9HYPO|nr:hypothetical protein CDD80_2761 [Ophiocordyceps camponoti-rufipedis]
MAGPVESWKSRDLTQAATSSLLASETLTVLAPLNSALDALPRKPWEDEADYHQFGSAAYEGDDGRTRAQNNSSRFVDAHIVPVSPWPKETRVRSRAGRELWWELSSDGSTRYLMPDRVQVDRVAARASNGELVSSSSSLSLPYSLLTRIFLLPSSPCISNSLPCFTAPP